VEFHGHGGTANDLAGLGGFWRAIFQESPEINGSNGTVHDCPCHIVKILKTFLSKCLAHTKDSLFFKTMFLFFLIYSPLEGRKSFSMTVTLFSLYNKF